MHLAEKFKEFASQVNLLFSHNIMKNNIHPQYAETSIRCACGNEIEVGSTKTDIRVEICSKCHPFFTGKQKLVDTAGRIERFHKKYEKFQKPSKPN